MYAKGMSRLITYRKEIETRLSDLESITDRMEEAIPELTPSDDLEKVKVRLNEVIQILNKVFIRSI